MKESKKNELLEKHNQNNEGTLLDAYNKPSRNKLIAWDAIINDARDLKAVTQPKVNTFNTFMYTASFEYVAEGMRRLRYYTQADTYDFIIE